MLRIASYNILHGKFVDMDLRILGADIAALGADLVGLQEVDQFAARSGSIDSVRILSESAGLPHAAFARAIPLQGGEYGTAILSRYPILSFTVTPLESGAGEKRSFGHAVLDVNGQTVHFINTHLSLGGRENREAQFAAIAAQLPGDAPWIVTGDFNTEDFSEFVPLGGSLLNCAENRMLSFYPGGAAIDNIVRSSHWTPGDSGMAESTHSDHNMIWCDAELKNKN